MSDQKWTALIWKTNRRAFLETFEHTVTHTQQLDSVKPCTLCSSVSDSWWDSAPRVGGLPLPGPTLGETFTSAGEHQVARTKDDCIPTAGSLDCVCVRVCVRLWVHVCALWEVKMFALVLFPIAALFNAVFSLFFFLYSLALTVRTAQAFPLLCAGATHICIAAQYHLFNTPGKPGLFEMETYSRVTHPEETYWYWLAGSLVKLVTFFSGL